MSEKHTFLMMIQDRWWKEFLLRQKEEKKIHAYVLRGPAPPKTAQRILFYVTKPVAKLAGYADFIERKVGTPGAIWEENGEESVLSSKKMYDGFIKGSDKVSCVRFKNLREAGRPVPLNEVLMFFGVRRLARKGFYIDKDTADNFIASMSQT